MSGNNVWYWAPRGADEVVGAWNKTVGSPFLTRTGAEHPLAAGTAVSGSGIPEGTFLKRIFPDGSIELSQPVEAPVADDSVTFAALNPKFTEALNTWRCIGAGAVGLVKYREQDEARLVFASYSGGSPRSITMPANTADLFPGTVVLSNACNLTYALRLGRCRVELPGTELAGGAGLPNVPSVHQLAADAVSALVVPAGVSAVVNNFTNLIGTVVKEGAGSLTLKLDEELDGNTGTLTVEEGTLVVSSVGSPFVKSISIKAGARLKLPEGAFRCTTLAFEPGAVIDGPGELVCAETPASLEGLVLRNGAEVNAAGVKAGDFVYEVPEGAVAGDPALWLEIGSGVETDGSGEHVLRWNDMRGANHMFVTNRNETLKPQLVKDADGKAVSVYLPCDETSTSADEQAILAWSKGLGNIRAVFVVKGCYMGGGQFLGGITDMTWYRQGAGSRSFSYKLFEDTASAALKNGRFYANGALRSVESGYAYPGGVTNGTSLAAWRPQLAEFITSGNAYADNFAYNRGGSGRSGRQLIHAAIIYTNELTEVQRLATEQYLLKKYGLVDVNLVDPSGLPGSVGSLELSGGTRQLGVAAGGALAVDAITGAGAVTKTGAGSLFVKDLADAEADVTVAAGELVIRSIGSDAASLPGHPALHVDASLVSSVTTNSAGKVTQWADVRGADVNKAVPVPGCWGKPVVEENAVGTRAAISFGSFGSYKTYDNASPALRYDNLKAYAYFHVMASVSGGGFLLGCCDDISHNTGGEYYGIFRQAHDATHALAYNAEFRRPNWEVRDYDYGFICRGAGATVSRVNGVDADLTATMPSSDFRLIACSMPEPINTSGFAQYRNSEPGKAGAYVYGGMKVGESVVYTNVLSREATLRVEAYMNRKWFGVDTPCYREAAVKTLTVAAGATAKVTGGGALTAKAIVGTGTVDGSVALADGGTLTATVLPDRSVVAPSVTGALDLSAGGTLVLDDTLARPAGGEHLLAERVTGSVDGWTVTSRVGKSQAALSLVIRDGALYLLVRPRGLMLIMR